MNHIHDIEKGLPRNIVEGKKSKLTCNTAALSSIVNKSEIGLEYPRVVPVIIHARVASPLIVIPAIPMRPERDVPEQDTLDVADK